MAAFEPIERFEDIAFELTNEKENELLEYVIMVADHFFPDYDEEYDPECKERLPSLYTREFKAYYNQKDGLVYPVTVKEYITNKTIQLYLKYTALALLPDPDRYHIFLSENPVLHFCLHQTISLPHPMLPEFLLRSPDHCPVLHRTLSRQLRQSQILWRCFQMESFPQIPYTPLKASPGFVFFVS